MPEQQHSSSSDQVLPLDLKERLVTRFVQDAIIRAAVDQAAFEIHDSGVFALFGLQFSFLVYDADARALFCPKDGSVFPKPRNLGSVDDVAAILRAFHTRLTTAEPRTGVLAADPSSTPGSLNVHAPAIFEAARQGPWSTAGMRRPMDPFVASILPCPVLKRLEELTISREELAHEPRPEAGPLAALKHVLERAGKDSVFTCGGTFRSDILQLRFDRPDGSPDRVTLPVRKTMQSDEDALDRLLASCEPATFGYQGQDILDNEYRKALKLEPSRFCIDFHPADHGILQTIADTMLRLRTGSYSLSAVLYKLNIYETSGRFKAHVDTPRSESQLASLVICLPVEHTGGQLAVRHAGEEVIYDWGQDPGRLQWAAFFSDCEHEVLEVQSGNRITLIYNLYVVPNEVRDQSLDLETLPVCRSIKSALCDPRVLPNGGLMGFHCHHAYARHRKSSSLDVLACLKGVDRQVFLAFRQAGIGVGIAPVLSQIDMQAMVNERLTSGEGQDYYYCDSDVEDDEDQVLKPRWSEQFEQLLDRVQDSPGTFEIVYKDVENMRGTGFNTFEERLTYTLYTRRIRGLKSSLLELDLENAAKAGEALGSASDRIGLAQGCLGNVQIPSHEVREGDDEEDELFEYWPRVPGIKWLNKQDGRDSELAMAYMKYGNQSELEHHYASIAIIARVPPYGTAQRPASVDVATEAPTTSGLDDEDMHRRIVSDAFDAK
ncbi:uncharacterized protein AB675_4234 [Cyphellophora attinorum]|uniref:Fe2OG dioxygenase domain-containing protein n=1 Tax=Cyphellophora attinorum TaxID=1664694 RepID=A0A0N1HRN2_9EURO|nr:uncharacterized protein AB675_4234 [Phialophora attinorum]KPI38516.1 hypothetical protein AB675_4234 [Phialophora attinorum]